jgi:hypothetical protein
VGAASDVLSALCFTIGSNTQHVKTYTWKGKGREGVGRCVIIEYLQN